MNTKVNDENVKALLERAKSSMAVSGNFGALVFTAAVVFVSLSHQTCVSYILSSILIFTTFLFVLNIGIWENVIASCTKENFENKVEMMTFGDNVNAVGFFLMIISMCLLAFYVNLYVGVLITPLIIIVSVIVLKHIPSEITKKKWYQFWK